MGVVSDVGGVVDQQCVGGVDWYVTRACYVWLKVTNAGGPFGWFAPGTSRVRPSANLVGTS